MPVKKIIDPERLKDWKHRGPEAAYFQREAQVNLWTVMGGLAAGALLTQIDLLLQEVQGGRWYLLLYAANTLMIIVNSWVQSAWGSLAMPWRLTGPDTLVFFLNLFIVSLIALAVTRPVLWVLLVGVMVLLTLGQQYMLKRIGAWELYTEAYLARVRTVNWIYFLFAILTFGAAAQMYWLPSRISEIVWGGISLVLSFVALYLQHNGMEIERRNLRIP